MNYKKFFALLLTTSVLLMVVALYNGFPLVENDSGAYIEQAIYPHFAADRTPFYGLFLRFTSLWTSLWFTVFAQCLILSYLLLQYIFQIQKAAQPTIIQSEAEVQNPSQPNPNSQFPIPNYNLTLISIVAIVSFTCVSWVTSYLMPDVFAGILLLAIFLYISDAQKSLVVTLSYIGIIFLAILIHNSHFAITLLFSLTLLTWALMKKNKQLVTKCLSLIAVCIGVWVVLCSMNKIKKHGFTFSRGSDIFIMAKLAETGVLDQYLADNCDRKNIDLCKYREHMPASAMEFMWSGESPLYKTGGWDSTHPDYKIIIHDVLTTPRYAGMFARKCFVNMLKELTLINAPDNVLVMDQRSEPWKKVHQYFADELPAYTTSMQNSNALTTGACNLIYYLFFICSTLWLLLFYPRVMNKELLFIYCCMLLFFVINALVTASFSTVIYRFQYRIFWLLPATNAIIITRYYLSRVANTEPQNPGPL